MIELSFYRLTYGEKDRGSETMSYARNFITNNSAGRINQSRLIFINY